MVGIKNNGTKYLLFAIVTAVLVSAFLVVRPFIGAIVISAFVAYLLHPVYRRLNALVKRKTLSALIVTVLILPVIIVPIFFVVKVSTSEATFVYLRMKQELAGKGIVEQCSPDKEALCSIISSINEILTDEKIKPYIADLTSRFANYVLSKSYSLLISLPKLVLDIVIAFFVIFYLLRDGDSLVNKLKDAVPVKAEHRDHIFLRIKNTLDAVFFGAILMALIQGIAAFLGFVVFGAPLPLLWGIATVFAAFVPLVGTSLVMLPVGLSMVLSGLASDSSGTVGRGIALIIYGVIVVGGIDNVLKPVLIGTKARIHPALMLVGVLGGIVAFGIAGVIIGAVIVALVKAMFDIYCVERKCITSE